MKVRDLLRELVYADPDAEVMIHAPRSGDSALILPTVTVETGTFPNPRPETGKFWLSIWGTDAWGQYVSKSAHHRSASS